MKVTKKYVRNEECNISTKCPYIIILHTFSGNLHTLHFKIYYLLYFWVCYIRMLLIQWCLSFVFMVAQRTYMRFRDRGITKFRLFLCFSRNEITYLLAQEAIYFHNAEKSCAFLLNIVTQLILFMNIICFENKSK